MRNEQDIMDLLLRVALEDERIRAVVMEGSRANAMVPKDSYQDYDIVYFVSDITPFYNHPEWVIEKFGNPLIMQMPEQMRYPVGNGNFNYMMIYEDGVRIDLSFKYTAYQNLGEPGIVLLDKDQGQGFIKNTPTTSDSYWHVKKPNELFYLSCCNNFWWCLNNVAKGIARDELPYVMNMLNGVVRMELHDMMDYYIGCQHNFQISTGKDGKYYKKLLPAKWYAQYKTTYPNSDYESIWNSIDVMCDMFHNLTIRVGEHLNFPYNQDEEVGMRYYLEFVRRNISEQQKTQ